MTLAVWTDDDPGVGDVAEMSALVGRLARIADTAGGTRLRLVGLDASLSGVDWAGSAADAFAARIGKLPGHLSQLEASYRAAAEGFAVYARAVTEIAADTAVATASRRGAGEDLDWARSQQQAWPGPGLNPYDAHVVDAQRRIDLGRARLAELASRRRAEDVRVVATLHEAHEVGMHNASGWSHFWGGVSHEVTSWASNAWHGVEDGAEYLAELGEYYYDHPDVLGEQLLGAATMLGGAAMIAAGGAGEGLGLALDATGVGAVAGVPINVASAALIGAGAVTVVGGVTMSMDAATQTATGTAEADDVANEVEESAKSMADRWNNPKAIKRHFADHRADFGADTIEQYTEMAEEFFENRTQPGMEVKIDSMGVVRVYDPATNTFGSYEPDTKIKTFFKPTIPNYWQVQPGVTP